MGYLVGNGRANPTIENNSRIKFAHGMALISDELYESLRRSCGGEYYNVDPSNSECLQYVGDFDKCTSGLEGAHILLPKCTYASPKPKTHKSPVRRSLDEDKNTTTKPVQELLQLEADPPPTLGCPTFAYLLSKYWANDEAVQAALQVRKVLNLFILVSGGNSGDHDLMVPYVGTMEWIKSMNFRIVEEWRPWLLNNQVAGYTRIYSHPAGSNLMTFATVKGGGHTAPEYKPPECFAMFQRWITEEPL
ncbi:Serine carboxypeptidase-like 19 [Linum perenne]